jgi:hypothetical protein
MIFLDAEVLSYGGLQYADEPYSIFLELLFRKAGVNVVGNWVYNGDYMHAEDSGGVQIDIRMDVDTLRWSSLAYQLQHPPISEWDSCRLDRKFIYTRNLERDINVLVKPSLVAGNEGWVIKRNNGKLIWEDHKDWGEVRADSLVTRTVKNRRKFYAIAYRPDDWSTVPARRGIKIAYPLFFQYKGVLYGFSAIQWQPRNSPGHGIMPTSDYYLSKWTGEGWELIMKD